MEVTKIPKKRIHMIEPTLSRKAPRIAPSNRPEYENIL